MAGRIIFLNRFFYPDHSATSQILGDLAFHLAGQGERVHVIASRQAYDDPVTSLPRREHVKGVEVHRIATTRFGRKSNLGRALDYASFHVSAAATLLRIARRGDVVVAKTDPPMLSVLTAALGTLRKFKTVNWLQDLYPEIAAAAGIRGTTGLPGRLLSGLRNRSLRRATMNIAVGEAMAGRVRALGISPDRLQIIANWCDDEAIRPVPIANNSLRREWALVDKFVVAHAGNLGQAHDIDTILGAASLLRAHAQIVFLVVGGGHGFRQLEAEVRKRGLQNFRFEPYQSRERVADALGVADVHWMSLKPGLDGLLLPSKFYGIAAAGRPLVIVGTPDGELAQLVGKYDCGFTVPVGEHEQLARTLLGLERERSVCARLGHNARHMLEERLTRSAALERWLEVLRAMSVWGGKEAHKKA